MHKDVVEGGSVEWVCVTAHLYTVYCVSVSYNMRNTYTHTHTVEAAMTNHTASSKLSLLLLPKLFTHTTFMQLPPAHT